MIEQLVINVFNARNHAHRFHWLSKSYSRHMALGDFYNDIIEVIDSLVEKYQGQFDLVGAFEVKPDKCLEIVSYLREQMDWIESNRTNISGGSSMIENQIDELTAVYAQAVYKLENLG